MLISAFGIFFAHCSAPVPKSKRDIFGQFYLVFATIIRYKKRGDTPQSIAPFGFDQPFLLIESRSVVLNLGFIFH